MLRLASLAPIAFLPFGEAAEQRTTDLILHSGVVITETRHDAPESHRALACAEGRILAVGDDEEILKLRGDATRVVDLQGKTVIPGLIDSHVHPGAASMFELDHLVPAMESIGDVLKYNSERARIEPAGKWIWVEQVFITRLKEQRFPTKAELDVAAPQHPVVFSTGPDAMANSLALSLSGIDRDFQATGPGQIERDPKTGEPTGMLRGGTKRFLKSIPGVSRASDDERLARLEKLLADYHACGITAISDRNASPADIANYRALAAAGRLTMRVAISHAVDAQEKPEAVHAAIRAVGEHPLHRDDPQLKIVGIKTFLDGGMLTGSAYMREPWGVSQIYGISDPEYRGVRFIEPDLLAAYVRTAVESNLQFTAHSVGDGAVHALLEAYERVSRDLPIGATRPCLTHSNFMSLEAIDQMVELGVVADIQPVWLYLDARTLSAQFGDDRLRYFQPLASLFAAGAIVGAGSDHMQKIGSLRSVNPYNPFLGMWVAVTRQATRFEGQLHGEEALTRQQALQFYTINNAHLLFWENDVGTLTPGKRADFVILDRNLLTCPTDDLKDAQVLATYVDGKQVYERAP
jgi:predicted amidohydrolase YtcJ